MLHYLLLITRDSVLQESDGEEVAEPYVRKRRTQEDPAGLDFGSGDVSRGSNDSDDDRGEESGLESYASYGQLVGPPSYEESVLYDSVVNASNGGGATSVAAAVSTPPLSIRVCDPQKKEQSKMFGMHGAAILSYGTALQETYCYNQVGTR